MSDLESRAPRVLMGSNVLVIVCVLLSAVMWYRTENYLDESDARLDGLMARSEVLQEDLKDTLPLAVKGSDGQEQGTTDGTATPAKPGTGKPPKNGNSLPYDPFSMIVVDEILKHRLDSTAKPPFFRFSWDGNCFLAKAIRSRILPSDRYLFFGDETPGPGEVSVNTKLVDPKTRKWQLVVSKTADPRRTNEIFSTEIYEVRNDLARAYAAALVDKKAQQPICKSCYHDCIKLIEEEVKRLQRIKD